VFLVVARLAINNTFSLINSGFSVNILLPPVPLSS
jgi:hypothetical protein